MQLVFVMVLRSILRLLGPVIALIDRLIPGVTGKETVLPEEGVICAHEAIEVV